MASTKSSGYKQHLQRDTNMDSTATSEQTQAEIATLLDKLTSLADLVAVIVGDVEPTLRTDLKIEIGKEIIDRKKIEYSRVIGPSPILLTDIHESVEEIHLQEKEAYSTARITSNNGYTHLTWSEWEPDGQYLCRLQEIYQAVSTPPQLSFEKQNRLYKRIVRALYAATKITLDHDKAREVITDLCLLHQAENDDSNGERTQEEIDQRFRQVETDLCTKYNIRD
jgi:hypothetical protein